MNYVQEGDSHQECAISGDYSDDSDPGYVTEDSIPALLSESESESESDSESDTRSVHNHEYQINAMEAEDEEDSDYENDGQLDIIEQQALDFQAPVAGRAAGDVRARQRDDRRG